MLFTLLLACADQNRGPKDVSETTATNEPAIGGNTTMCSISGQPRHLWLLDLRTQVAFLQPVRLTACVPKLELREKTVACLGLWQDDQQIGLFDRYSARDVRRKSDCTFELLDFRRRRCKKQNGY